MQEKIEKPIIEEETKKIGDNIEEEIKKIEGETAMEIAKKIASYTPEGYKSKTITYTWAEGGS